MDDLFSNAQFWEDDGNGIELFVYRAICKEKWDRAFVDRTIANAVGRLFRVITTR